MINDNYGALKKQVSLYINKFLIAFQERYNNSKNSNIIKTKLNEIEKNVSIEAKSKLKQVMKEMGIL
jgi:hypothetical protein